MGIRQMSSIENKLLYQIKATNPAKISVLLPQIPPKTTFPSKEQVERNATLQTSFLNLSENRTLNPV